MSNGIVELIKDIGNENIDYQWLKTSMIKFKDNAKTNDREITFATSKDKMDSGKQAIIIWVDNDKLTKSVEKLTKE